MLYQHALRPALQQRAASGNPIRLGLLGCGSMGGDLIEQMRLLDGMEIAAIADRRPEKIRQQLLNAGITEDRICHVSTLSESEQAVSSGKIAITDNLDLIARTKPLEAVIDATGKPSVGAQHGLTAIRHGTHLVMMNVESDVTIGTFLHHEAQKNGVIYTLGAGDEPSSTMELVHFVENMGFEVIAAGKGKNNPLNRQITPADLIHEAETKKMNPRVLSEFVDGTKTMVEMTALANATGLRPDIAGMHGQAIGIEALHKKYIPKEHGGIFTRRGVVDYSVGHGVPPGVFVVAHIDSPRLCARMEYLVLGEGPFYTFYRPYHLTSLEVPISCARAVLYGVADMTPRAVPVAEATAKTKRAIAKGERIDGIGETCYHGWILERTESDQKRAIPLGLLDGATAIRDIPVDTLLTYHDVTPNADDPIVKLRAEQDRIGQYVLSR